MRWFIGAIVVLAAALLLESGLLAYSMYVLLGLLLLTRWLSRAGVENISATRSVRRPRKKGDEPSETTDLEDDPSGGLALEIGDRLVVTIVLHNDGTLGVPWLLAEDSLPGDPLRFEYPRLKIRGKRALIASVPADGEQKLKYQVECLSRGYFQIGPLVLESGDLFGLHRRFRVVADPKFVLVYPRIVPLAGYDLASRRPIGDVRMAHRLFEDPTRIAGVRPYQQGDPLNRVHWRATARTGQLHSKIHEPSTLSGVTVLLDFHRSGYPKRGEPVRSELAVTAAVSLANAVFLLGQQVGLLSNARDAAERIRTEGWRQNPATRLAARAAARDLPTSEKVDPLVVPTRRGAEQLQRIRETLARAELGDGLELAGLITEAGHRMPRDATVLAILGDVSIDSAIALGNLRRRGMAVAVVLVLMDDGGLERAYARLVAEGIRDLRHLADEATLPDLCRNHVNRLAPYDFAGLGV